MLATDTPLPDTVDEAVLPAIDLPWIGVAPGAPYFVTEEGSDWTPIGQNDAITWATLHGLLGRRDLGAVESYLWRLRGSGVTCLRLMLEYCEGEDHYFERPAGRFQPAMVQLWDDLFALCARVGIHVLLTPFDTFFTWNRWPQHPYNRNLGGPCADRTQLMKCAKTRELVKARLAFASKRWGGSGVLFAWDLWNEAHPVQADNQVANIVDYIDDVGTFLRDLEIREHGRAHLQTVSVFGPELDWKPWMRDCIFRHPALDFANSHIYEEGTIDYPRDTVAPALGMARIVAEHLSEITDARPFFDSEHGPIHSFKDHKLTLPEAFDDEYFRHMQWAHLAAGAAGGGMRWPNRHPHRLTPGMLDAQRAMSGFLPLIDWRRFRRRNLNGMASVSLMDCAIVASGDDSQAVCWLVRTDSIGADGLLRQDAPPVPVSIALPGLRAGPYRMTVWDTRAGAVSASLDVIHDGDSPFRVALPPIRSDFAVAVRWYRTR